MPLSLIHILEGSGQTASIDALCPFGAVETLWRFITTGQFVPKTHPSNLILGAGLLIGIVLAGSSFCGWVCPFGALQDALTWLRKALHLPEIKVPAKADHILRYGRFVTLGLILFMTVSTVKLLSLIHILVLTAASTEAAATAGRPVGTGRRSLLQGATVNALSPHPWLFWATVGGPRCV